MITAIVIFSIAVFITLIFTVLFMARAITGLRQEIEDLKYKEAEAFGIIDQQESTLDKVTHLLDDRAVGAATQFSEMVLLMACLPHQQDRNTCLVILQTSHLFESFLVRLMDIMPFSYSPANRRAAMKTLETARQRALDEIKERERAQ